jgi:hypothetical protein
MMQFRARLPECSTRPNTFLGTISALSRDAAEITPTAGEAKTSEVGVLTFMRSKIGGICDKTSYGALVRIKYRSKNRMSECSELKPISNSTV